MYHDSQVGTLPLDWHTFLCKQINNKNINNNKIKENDMFVLLPIKGEDRKNEWDVRIRGERR